MKCRSMRSDDRSWPIRLTDLDKCYNSCNYLLRVWLKFKQGVRFEMRNSIKINLYFSEFYFLGVTTFGMFR